VGRIIAQAGSSRHIPLLAAEILKSDDSCISNPEIPKSQIGLPEPPCQLFRVQFKIFGISGFDMQESSDLMGFRCGIRFVRRAVTDLRWRKRPDPFLPPAQPQHGSSAGTVLKDVKDCRPESTLRGLGAIRAVGSCEVRHPDEATGHPIRTELFEDLRVSPPAQCNRIGGRRDRKAKHHSASCSAEREPLRCEDASAEQFRGVDPLSGKSIVVGATGCNRVQYGGRAEEVLFDAEVYGTRYLFIRMPKTEKCRLSPPNRKSSEWLRKDIPTKLLPTF
jgi:hypothetical protein